MKGPLRFSAAPLDQPHFAARSAQLVVNEPSTRTINKADELVLAPGVP